MPGVRDHLDQQEPGLSPARRHPAGPGSDTRPTITGKGDPRLAHASSGAQSDLMHVQRTAGNAAVSTLMVPSVQRAVTIDEITSTVEQEPGQDPPSGTGQAPAGPGQAQSTTPGAADGGQAEADHTITASHIGLNAPMVEASGVIRAQTVIADSIVAENYTPGAGNVW